VRTGTVLASNGCAADGWFGRGDCGAVMYSPLLSKSECYLKIGIRGLVLLDTLKYLKSALTHKSWINEKNINPA
jgi:hypothetical protein